MTAEIICIGSEIISGLVIDVNSGFISKQLSIIGVETKYISVINDDPESILSALDIARYRAELIVVTGGLGPTSDDITMETVANYFSRDLEINEDIMKKIDERVSKNKETADNAYKMALVPQNSVIFKNDVGVAPGILIKDDEIILIMLPGVPKEVKSIMSKYVIPYLKETTPKMIIKEKLIKTTGISESILFEKVRNLDSEPDELSFLPKNTGVDLKIRVVGENEEEVQERLEKISSVLKERLQEWIYSVNGQEFEEVIGKILIEKGLSIAVAESCTGGLIANMLTNVPGSSRYFDRGIVTYSNMAKVQELGVKRETLEKFGAVSEEISREMALGLIEKCDVDVGISTTGIAGPGGGSKEKPLGLVYISTVIKNNILTKKYVFDGNRVQNKENFAIAALIQLYKMLTNENL